MTPNIRRLVTAAGWALGTLLMIGLPTDIIANPVFRREVPVRPWEPWVLAATVVLTYAWFAVQGDPRPRDKPRLAGGLALALFAVACPVCNKVVLLLLGTSGALGVWAPAQPYLAALSLVALAVALGIRIRNSECSGVVCGPGSPGSPAGAGDEPLAACCHWLETPRSAHVSPGHRRRPPALQANGKKRPSPGKP